MLNGLPHGAIHMYICNYPAQSGGTRFALTAASGLEKIIEFQLALGTTGSKILLALGKSSFVLLMI